MAVKAQTISLKTKKSLWHGLLHIVLILTGICMLLPFIWMVSASLKPEVDVFKFPIEWIPQNITFENYKAIFSGGRYNFSLFYWNSFKIASIVTLIQLVTCSLAGYAFSKIEFPGRDKIFFCYLGTLMVPFQVTMIPLFIIMKYFNLIDSHGSLILINAFSAYGVFLLRQFYLGIPNELSEAATIDGCNHFKIYTKIMLPNIKPALATLALFTFLGEWNNFLAPLIFINSTEKMTITLGLKTFISEYNIEFAKMMAGTAISVLPIIIIFFIAQRYFIEGIALSGVKG